MLSVTEAEEILAENFAPWVRALAPVVEETAPDGIRMRMPVTPEIARVGGIVSGQALAALADTAMVLAACAQAGRFVPVATTNLDLQFLRPGGGEAILCDAEIVRAGRALVFARATLTAMPAGKAVAVATATFYAP
ncbi:MULTISPECIES: PaaI family thioesterase [unclassified Rhodosalinus]|uniref:PaaI family thioesterase n=1 Tax=unclassified Rhodosalinus TaxID=2630183 RepID=UPI003523EB75